MADPAGSKQKKDKEASGADGEASFFHGDFSSGVVDFADCDSHHSLQRQHSHDALQFGGEALAIASLSTSPTTFLADSGASHHICHDRSFFCKLSCPLSKVSSKSIRCKDPSMSHTAAQSC